MSLNDITYASETTMLGHRMTTVQQHMEIKGISAISIAITEPSTV